MDKNKLDIQANRYIDTQTEIFTYTETQWVKT